MKLIDIRLVTCIRISSVCILAANRLMFLRIMETGSPAVRQLRLRYISSCDTIRVKSIPVHRAGTVRALREYSGDQWFTRHSDSSIDKESVCHIGETFEAVHANRKPSSITYGMIEISLPGCEDQTRPSRHDWKVRATDALQNATRSSLAMSTLVAYDASVVMHETERCAWEYVSLQGQHVG